MTIKKRAVQVGPILAGQVQEATVVRRRSTRSLLNDQGNEEVRPVPATPRQVLDIFDIVCALQKTTRVKLRVTAKVA